MALVLCKGKPYSPPTIHGYAFVCRGPEGEFPGPDTLWGADVEEKDFHKFLIGVEGSPFWLDDAGVVVPPPPPPPDPVVPSTIQVPGAVPTSDPAAANALALAAAASGALNTDTPPPPAGSGSPDDVPPPATPENVPALDPEALAAAYSPFAALRSKADIATLAKSQLGMELDPENGKMAEMLEAVKAELTRRLTPTPQPPQV